MRVHLERDLCSGAFRSRRTCPDHDPDVSGAPSAQNSGAGIAGQPGNKNGPAAKPGETVGTSSNSNQQNPTIQQQDTSNIKDLPGNKCGPPAKQPDRK